jgi:hypothetical protein
MQHRSVTMPDWLNSAMGWIIALVLGALSIAQGWRIQRDRKAEADGADSSDRSNMRGQVVDHELRIRRLEGISADVKSELTEVRTDVRWIRKQMEKE